MSRKYFPATVFRMTPKNTLKEVFTRFGIDVSTIQWDELNFRNVEPLQVLFNSLAPECREQMDTILRSIHLLACRPGMDAINHAIDIRHQSTQQFGIGSAINLYERAALVWMADPELLDLAASLFELKGLPWWQVKRGLIKRKPVFTEDVRHQFEEQLEKLFMDRQNRGEVCTVEMQEFGNGVYYFFAYPDDYPKFVLQHDKARTLFSQTFRPTFEVVFAYDSIQGTLAICGKVPQTLKEQLEEIFIKTIFNTISQPKKRHVYDLSVLKTPNFVAYTDPWDMVHVTVEAITLYEESRHKYSIDFGKDDIYEEIDQRKHHYMALEAAKNVRKARFRFDFHAKKGRPAVSITFEIGEPSRNTLNYYDYQYVRIINMYLERWGIAHEKSMARVA